jgi:hypothetical protein
VFEKGEERDILVGHIWREKKPMFCINVFVSIRGI